MGIICFAELDSCGNVHRAFVYEYEYECNKSNSLYEDSDHGGLLNVEVSHRRQLYSRSISRYLASSCVAAACQDINTIFPPKVTSHSGFEVTMKALRNISF